MRFRLVLYPLVLIELFLFVALARGLKLTEEVPAVWPGCDVAELIENGPWALPMCQWRDA